LAGEQPASPSRAARLTTFVKGLYESINPDQHPPGWTFVDKIKQSATSTTVITGVTAPDGTTGTVTRSYKTATGEFVMDYADLEKIPKRMVKTDPEMLPGEGTPLEAYMTMRQMRIIERLTGAAFTGPRTVVMSSIINVRTILELAKLEKNMPVDEAILQTHSVQYANNSIVQTGGRIVGAKVEGSMRERAITVADPDVLAEYGVKPNDMVRHAFDIILTVEPAATPAGPTP
jgi:hypothetical protein